MEAVNVFRGVDGFEDAFRIDLGGKRKLDEDAIDVVVSIQVTYELQHVVGGNSSGRGVQPTGHAELFAGGDFTFDVDLRCGIFADEDGSEAGANSLRAEFGKIGFQFGEDFVADFQAVENACGH